MQAIFSLSKVTPKEMSILRREYPLQKVCDFITSNYYMGFSGQLAYGSMRKNRTHYYMQFIYSGAYGRESVWICQEKKNGQWFAEIANGEFVGL